MLTPPADPMVPRFVGVVVEDAQESVLLLKRSSNVLYFPGIWCIPGGCVESGEAPEDAAIREVLEESGLQLNQVTPVRTFARPNGSVAVFISQTPVMPTYNPEPNNADALATFRLDDLPEDIGLESWLAIAEIAQRRGVLLSSNIVLNRAFSSLFYSYLWPGLQNSWRSTTTAPILFHTLRQTPFRKFKGGLIAFLGECAPAIIPYAMLAEALFAAMYVYDDLCDDKTTRYGRSTARGTFGITRCASFLLQIGKDLNQWFKSIAPDDTTTATKIADWIAHTCDIQNRRHSRELPTLSAYESDAVERTRFLGEVWRAGLDAAGFLAERDLIVEVYPLYALAGQLRNDLKEFGAAGTFVLEDVARGVWTYPWICWAQACSPTDLCWLMDFVWGKGAAAVQPHASRLMAMVLDSGVLDHAQRRIIELVTIARQVISRSDIGDPKATLLDAWMTHQFERDVVTDVSSQSNCSYSLITSLAMLTCRAVPCPIIPTASE